MAEEPPHATKKTGIVPVEVFAGDMENGSAGEGAQSHDLHDRKSTADPLARGLGKAGRVINGLERSEGKRCRWPCPRSNTRR